MFDFECCPNTALGICGGAIRGSCESIAVVDRCQNSANDTELNKKYCKAQQFLQSRPGTGRTDFRYNWPTQIFQRVCVCRENYDGYNCMRCKRGYTGDDCLQPLPPVVRRNILSLNEIDQQRIINIIQMTKSLKASGYTVPIIEPVITSPSDSFVEISLYDIFVSFHYNTLRDEQINKCPSESLIQTFCSEGGNECPIPDFAHEGPAFLTWHRGYLLYVETEIQKMLDDPTFALPYWDWTNEDKLWDLIGRSDCGIFSADNETEEAPVNGPFASWDTICTNVEDIVCDEDNQVCNPTQNFDKINRCIGGIQEMQCWVDRTLPSIREINEALTEHSYDVSPYSTDESQGGFRNALEGFKKFPSIVRNENACDHTNWTFRTTELHNRVHLYIGGTMLSVPMASNDPVFFLHHCNIDRLYEEWLDQFSDNNFPSYKPSEFNYSIAPGHNIDEYLVPMFPLITNRDMHNRATSLGYAYKEPMPSQGSGCIRSQMVCMLILP